MKMFHIAIVFVLFPSAFSYPLPQLISQPFLSQRLPNLNTVLLSSHVQRPAGRLLSHLSGQGHIVQTIDGHVYYLIHRSAPEQTKAADDSPIAESQIPKEEDDEVVIAAKTSEENSENNTKEPVVIVSKKDESLENQQIGEQNPERSRVIATAPFTASTARFVSAVPDISAPSHITHISHSSPFLSFIASPDVRDDRTSDTEEISANDEVTNEEGTPSSSVVTGYFSFPSAGLSFHF